MRTIKTAVFVSGRGTNLLKLIEAQSNSNYEIVLVVSDQEHPPAFDHIKPGMSSASIVLKDRKLFAEAAETILNEYGIELIVLAGFMRILDGDLVDRWRDRIVNIHPSLLPDFPGLHPHRQALEAGAAYSGCTVHYVIPEVDAGPIIGQCTVNIEPDDTEEVLAERILQVEHKLYPIAVDYVARQLLEEQK